MTRSLTSPLSVFEPSAITVAGHASLIWVLCDIRGFHAPDEDAGRCMEGGGLID